MRAADALEKVAAQRPDVVERYLPDLLDRVAEMQTLAGFAATDPELRDWLLPVLRHHRGAGGKAIAKRAEKLLARLGE